MYKKHYIVGSLLFFPWLASAQTTVFTFITDMIGLLLLAMPALLGAAIAVFFWGVTKFIWHADDEKAVQEGKMYLVWGMVGIFVIIALWGIIGFIQTNLGLSPAGGLGTAPAVPTTIPII